MESYTPTRENIERRNKILEDCNEFKTIGEQLENMSEKDFEFYLQSFIWNISDKKPDALSQKSQEPERKTTIHKRKVKQPVIKERELKLINKRLAKLGKINSPQALQDMLYALQDLNLEVKDSRNLVSRMNLFIKHISEDPTSLKIHSKEGSTAIFAFLKFYIEILPVNQDRCERFFSLLELGLFSKEELVDGHELIQKVEWITQEPKNKTKAILRLCTERLHKWISEHSDHLSLNSGHLLYEFIAETLSQNEIAKSGLFTLLNEIKEEANDESSGFSDIIPACKIIALLLKLDASEKLLFKKITQIVEASIGTKYTQPKDALVFCETIKLFKNPKHSLQNAISELNLPPNESGEVNSYYFSGELLKL